MQVRLKGLTEHDFAFVSDVYNYYIEHSTVTFHTVLVNTEEVHQIIP